VRVIDGDTIRFAAGQFFDFFADHCGRATC
jgi:hypothetical protein